ncbi:hypothetical protein Tco_1021057 [Tanacetum coccineum]
MRGNSSKEVAEQVLSSFIVAACESMIGGTIMRPRDMVTASSGKTIEWSWPGHLTKMEGFVDGSASFPEVDIATPLAGETKLSSAAANVDDNSDVVPFGEETKEEKKTAK